MNIGWGTLVASGLYVRWRRQIRQALDLMKIIVDVMGGDGPVRRWHGALHAATAQGEILLVGDGRRWNL